jgi:hypothetical protein
LSGDGLTDGRLEALAFEDADPLEALALGIPALEG